MKDAIHSATALAERVSDRRIFDGGFLKLDRKLGDPPLAIRPPHMAQGDLPFLPPAEDEDGDPGPEPQRAPGRIAARLPPSARAASDLLMRI